mmetsp:Transcript_35216/g.80376  ORF Transcript_35216/g.80376 Transcript_35216/m.80376 type:complete len:287 (-) Transcript_35216:97-957(-)
MALGIIGGSGLYELEGLEDVQDVEIDTPFGKPSAPYRTGTLNGTKMVFLSRHGKGHMVMPNEINFRANIFGLKALGCKWVLASTAVGSLRQEIAPGHMVVPDQLIDRTHGRPSTFFGEGIAAHVGFGDPYSEVLRNAVIQACKEAGAVTHTTATYVCINGPAFSTKAESHLYRSWGCNIIGMTALPEAKLAMEAEMGFANLALATDYDCWHESEGHVTADGVAKVVAANAKMAKQVIAGVSKIVPSLGPCKAHTALDPAIQTERAYVSDAVKERLKPLLRRVLALE